MGKPIDADKLKQAFQEKIDESRDGQAQYYYFNMAMNMVKELEHCHESD